MAQIKNLCNKGIVLEKWQIVRQDTDIDKSINYYFGKNEDNQDNITITPYATIYPTVKFGSYLVQARGTRGVATTLVCPLDNVNDTEIYIIDVDTWEEMCKEYDKDSNNYLLISKGDYDYAMSSTILYNKDNYKVLKVEIK